MYDASSLPWSISVSKTCGRGHTIKPMIWESLWWKWEQYIGDYPLDKLGLKMLAMIHSCNGKYHKKILVRTRRATGSPLRHCICCPYSITGIFLSARAFAATLTMGAWSCSEDVSFWGSKDSIFQSPKMSVVEIVGLFERHGVLLKVWWWRRWMYEDRRSSSMGCWQLSAWGVSR